VEFGLKTVATATLIDYFSHQRCLPLHMTRASANIFYSGVACNSLSDARTPSKRARGEQCDFNQRETENGNGGKTEIVK